ncbi:AAA family ATPase [Serratia marcescens]|uniref:AAA family ATPase n=1 Tax=Serratia marcescens TaxID=615 RepID=UPI001375BA79|nr:AAA family ATPase [Serratia marcescens]
MKIESFFVQGLWGDKDISLNLNYDFNFIIGPNGIGKTTLLNLVTSILTVDIDSIAKIHFDNATVRFYGDDGYLYDVDVSKGVGDNDECIINYIISSKDSGENVFSRMFRTVLHDGMDDLSRTRRISRRYYHNEDVKSYLEKKIKVIWLPIGRFNPVSDRDYKLSAYGNSVDMRLGEVLENFVKYSSLINKSISIEMAEFQKDALLSSIDSSYREGLGKGSHKITPSNDKASLMEVFKEVGIPESKYKRRVSRMFTMLERVLDKIKSEQETDLSQEEITNAFSLSRSRYLVERYNEYKNKKDEISSRLNTFIDNINSLFEGRKIFYISGSNEISFICGQNDGLSLFDLSSGEKQLIILLGEVLLNENAPCVYIADEPEISLHVSWQEKLVESMSKLNSKMQVILATHSPDIVSIRTNKIIDMEEGLK